MSIYFPTNIIVFHLTAVNHVFYICQIPKKPRLYICWNVTSKTVKTKTFCNNYTHHVIHTVYNIILLYFCIFQNPKNVNFTIILLCPYSFSNNAVSPGLFYNDNNLYNHEDLHPVSIRSTAAVCSSVTKIHKILLLMCKVTTTEKL